MAQINNGEIGLSARNKINAAIAIVDNLNATHEQLTNKATDFSTINNTTYPSTKAVKDYFDLRKVENLISHTADQTINFNVLSASFTTFFSYITTANDARILSGKTLRIKGICIFNKTTVGNTTYEVEANVAGQSITVGAFTVGAPAIANQVHEFELVLNFRAASQARARFNYTRRNTTSELANYTTIPAGLIAFDNTLANTISFGIRLVTNATNNNLTRLLVAVLIE